MTAIGAGIREVQRQPAAGQECHREHGQCDQEDPQAAEEVGGAPAEQ
jgi:hypothetical protein